MSTQPTPRRAMTAAALATFELKPPLRKFTVARQYLLPIYDFVHVEAETVDEACTKAILEDDWGNSKSDDGSRDAGVTIITRGHVDNPYDNGPKLKVPDRHLESEALMQMACAALLDSRQAGGPRRSLRRAIALARMALPHHTV